MGGKINRPMESNSFSIGETGTFVEDFIVDLRLLMADRTSVCALNLFLGVAAPTPVMVCLFFFWLFAM